MTPEPTSPRPPCRVQGGAWLAVFVLTALLAAPGVAQPPVASASAAEVQLALERLRVVGSALYVAAHPDDENTAVLAWLARGAQVRTGYLALTRGDGGQNLIGSEKGDLLGLVRTEELLAARRIDGAEQLFTRAIDFGYTKSADEALEQWGREEILADVVRVVRSFRPDLIITRFPGDGRGRHGQHTASAILALEAFHAAADPERFPEQLDELSTWQAHRIVWDDWMDGTEAGDAALVSVDVGAYNPLLGRSYRDIAAASRSQHKSQGFGASAAKGSRLAWFQHTAGEPAAESLFDGIDLGWSRVPGGERLATLIDRAIERFDPRRPAAVVPLLIDALAELRRLPADPWLTRKESEIVELVRAAGGLWLEATAATPTAAPDREIQVTWTVVNRSSAPFVLERIDPPFADTALDLTQQGADEADLRNRNRIGPGPPLAIPPNQDPERPLEENRQFILARKIRVPASEPVSEAHWLRRPRVGQRYDVAPAETAVLPHSGATTTRLTLSLGGQRLEYEIPLLHHWTDPVEGERYRPFAVVPAVSVNLEGRVLVSADDAGRSVRAILTAGAPDVAGELTLDAPSGWRVTPASRPFALADAGEEHDLLFELVPEPGAVSGPLRARVEVEGSSSGFGRREIAYSHIPHRISFPLAEAEITRVDLRIGGPRVGYVMGAGDEVPQALRQVGYEVTLLAEPDLDTGDLAAFDAIVLGIRAYNVRPRLASQNRRLLDYARGGGTVVVQYNTAHGLVLPELGPHPLVIGRGRVALEDAPITLLDPDHPLLQSPNRISAADFDGWVQERGLYFASEWDPRYETVLAAHDPGEEDLAGGLLYLRHGEGVFIFTGYSFFRQLPAGVPGAFRLFANLVAGGRQR